MDKLNKILHELGITKVKLARLLGVSRQMIYNYLEQESMNKWPKDKRVVMLNLLGIKSPDEVDDIKVDTDYILEVERRIESMLNTSKAKKEINQKASISGIGKKEDREIINNIIDVISFELDDKDNDNIRETFTYLYHFLQTLNTSPELKYILAYVSKAAGFTQPLDFAFDEDDQFIFESIMFSAMTLYNGGGTSKSKITETHKRFVKQVEQKREEILTRTLELNSVKIQALKELGYNKITDSNGAELFKKMAEIESRRVTS